ncbi:hypothetical protein REPUB_Repub12eG0083000 [Reevesia pubescens]
MVALSKVSSTFQVTLPSSSISKTSSKSATNNLFLLMRSILKGPFIPRHRVSIFYMARAIVGRVPHHGYHGGAETGMTMGSVGVTYVVVAVGAKKGRGRKYYEEEYEDEEDVGSGGKKVKREYWYSGAEAGSERNAGLAGGLG